MGFTLSLTAALLAPLQCVVGLFAPWAKAQTQAQVRKLAPEAHSPAATHAAAPPRFTPHAQTAQPRAPAAPQAVRVVRVVDRGSRETRRMVISGRLADVCAELERLAALEAAAS